MPVAGVADDLLLIPFVECVPRGFGVELNCIVSAAFAAAAVALIQWGQHLNNGEWGAMGWGENGFEFSSFAQGHPVRSAGCPPCRAPKKENSLKLLGLVPIPTCNPNTQP